MRKPPISVRAAGTTGRCRKGRKGANGLGTFLSPDGFVDGRDDLGLAGKRRADLQLVRQAVADTGALFHDLVLEHLAQRRDLGKAAEEL